MLVLSILPATRIYPYQSDHPIPNCLPLVLRNNVYNVLQCLSNAHISYIIHETKRFASQHIVHSASGSYRTFLPTALRNNPDPLVSTMYVPSSPEYYVPHYCPPKSHIPSLLAIFLSPLFQNVLPRSSSCHHVFRNVLRLSLRTFLLPLTCSPKYSDLCCCYICVSSFSNWTAP